MEGKNVRGISYLSYAVVMAIMGLALIFLGYFLSTNLTSKVGEFVEISSYVTSYEKIENSNKVNVTCKYTYGGDNYFYVCENNVNQDDYPINTEEKVKINPNNPGEMLNSFNFYYILFIAGILFIGFAVIYFILEIVRLIRK